MYRTCFQINDDTNKLIDKLVGEFPRSNRSDVVRAAIRHLKTKPKRERVGLLREEFDKMEVLRLKGVDRRRKERQEGAK